MSPEMVDAMVERLASTYRIEVEDEMLNAWRASFSSTKPDFVEEAVNRWIATQQWFPSPAQMHGIFREMTPAPAPRVPVGTPGCNGSGWIAQEDDEGGASPCRRCNPFMYEVWQDKTLRRRYRMGEPVSKLVNVPQGVRMPEKCLVETRFEEPASPELVAQVVAAAKGLSFRDPEDASRSASEA